MHYPHLRPAPQNCLRHNRLWPPLRKRVPHANHQFCFGRFRTSDLHGSLPKIRFCCAHQVRLVLLSVSSIPACGKADSVLNIFHVVIFWTIMPELPEVETVARGLQRTVAGRRILSVTLGKTDFIDNPAAIEQHLPGRQIEAVERYGKFMLLRLSPVLSRENAAENGDAAPASLLVHLGMTGQ